MTEAHRKRILPLTLLLLDYLEERHAHYAHHVKHAANYAHHASYARHVIRYAAYHAAKYALYSKAPPLIPLVYKALSL